MDPPSSRPGESETLQQESKPVNTPSHKSPRPQFHPRFPHLPDRAPKICPMRPPSHAREARLRRRRRRRPDRGATPCSCIGTKGEVDDNIECPITVMSGRERRQHSGHAGVRLPVPLWPHNGHPSTPLPSLPPRRYPLDFHLCSQAVPRRKGNCLGFLE